MTTHAGDRALMQRLRAQLRAGGPITLRHDEARLLVDGLARLQQSNDRLRRQNRRLRQRLQAATGEVPADDADPAGAKPDAAAEAP